MIDSKEEDERNIALERPQSKTPWKSILLEAHELINGDRAKSYGDMNENFTRIAKLWEQLKPGTTFTKHDIPMFMMAVKLARQVNAPKRDNLTDIAGYAALYSMLK